jgi:heat-inducible transcriptional repressor
MKRDGMAEHSLDSRQRQVLLAVIAEYVETAEPVSSRAVARRHMRRLSPATIRNVMADLEDQGYLAQPHTSAGRVPTDAAYRFYVDAIGRMAWTPAPVAPVEGGPRARPVADAEQVMAGAPARLSTGSHLTGMLLAPPLKQTILDRVELLPLGDGRVLAVVVTDAGWVTTGAIAADARTSPDEVRETGRTLTRRYRGKTFQAIADDVSAPADPLDPLWARHRELLDQVVVLLRARTLYISGAIHMLDHPDLSDVATVRRLLRTFEEKARLVDLLSRMAQERGVQVLIGGENPMEEMQECSLITSTYTYRGQMLGVLGVVGPRRMPYSDVISLVDETARLVSQSLQRVRHELYIPS